MKFIPSILMIFSMVLFSFNTRWAINGLTDTLFWHITQFSSLILIFISAFLFGLWHYNNWKKEDFWHNWGEIIGIGLMAIPVYVFSLHYLTVRL